jgi:hypothetical protein
MEAHEHDNWEETGEESTFFEPSAVDVVIAKMMLQKGKMLPPELLDKILDYAAYWPHSQVRIDYEEQQGDLLRIMGTRADENRFLVSISHLFAATVFS